MPRYEIERSQNLRPRVGRYELGRVLHDGAFAKVKYGRDIETGRSVAIKIISKDTIFKHKLVDQIKRDISTMKLLKHPNVVQLYEVIASKSKIYVVLEYVAGGELFKEIALKGRFKEERARKYFQQLIDAVDYCHSRGIYHRDLKPENLLLDSHGNLKISDFGLSAVPQQLREDGLLHTTCGTPNYVAPEVFLCKGYDGAKADIWSCGVILFVLMAGYLPFEDSNLVYLYKKINKGEFKCPPWFSPDACKLLWKTLNPNPELRATIPSILQDPWFKKDYSMPSFEEDSDIPFDDVDAVLNESMERFVLNKDEMRQPRQPVHLNAFELIALSNELDLSSFFGQKQDLKHELHFTSRHPASEIISRMEEIAIPLGFNVLKHDYKMKLQGAEMGRMGHLSVAAEVFEVAPSLFMVEVRKACGDSSEYHKDCSSGACERNWLAYSLIHTKIRNKLSTRQMERLIYCRTNLRMLRKLHEMPMARQVNVDKFKLSVETLKSINQERDPVEDQIFHELYLELEEIDRRVSRTRARRVIGGTTGRGRGRTGTPRSRTYVRRGSGSTSNVRDTGLEDVHEPTEPEYDDDGNLLTGGDYGFHCNGLESSSDDIDEDASECDSDMST